MNLLHLRFSGGVRPKPPSPPNPLREHDDRTIYRASLEGALGGNKRRRKASRAGASVNMLKVPQHEVPAHHPPPGHQLVTLTVLASTELFKGFKQQPLSGSLSLKQVGNGEYTLRPYEEDPLTPPAFRRPTITLLTPAQIGSFQRLAEYWTKGLPECRVEPLCNATLDMLVNKAEKARYCELKRVLDAMDNTEGKRPVDWDLAHERARRASANKNISFATFFAEKLTALRCTSSSSKKAKTAAASGTS